MACAAKSRDYILFSRSSSRYIMPAKYLNIVITHGSMMPDIVIFIFNKGASDMKHLIVCIALCSYQIYGAAGACSIVIDTGKPRERSGLRLMRRQPTFMPIVHDFTPLDGEESSFTTKTVLVEQEVDDTSKPVSPGQYHQPKKLQRSFCHILLQGATEPKRNKMSEEALKFAPNNIGMRARELAAYRTHATTEDIELAKMDAQEFPTFYAKPEVAAFKYVFEESLEDYEVPGPRFEQLADMCLGFLQVEPHGRGYLRYSYEAVEGKKQLFGLKPSFIYSDSSIITAARIIMFNQAGRDLMTRLYATEPNIKIMLTRNLHTELIAALKEHAAKRNIKLCGVLVAPWQKPAHD